MNVALVPVIEIYCIDDTIKMPNGSWHEYPAEWEQYHRQCNKMAGFTELLNEAFPGSSLYRVTDLTTLTLRQLLLNAITKMKEDELDMEDLGPFSGGFILQLNGENKLLPQCCSDLLVIHEWEKLVNDYNGYFWQGHPSPLVTVEGDVITFNVEQRAPESEQFFPPLPDKLIVVNRLHLKTAIDRAKSELLEFANRLLAIEQAEGWCVEGIVKMLVG